MAVPGLHCRAGSSLVEAGGVSLVSGRRPLAARGFAPRRGVSRGVGLSRCGGFLPWGISSRAHTRQLWHMGIAVPLHGGSSQTRDQARVSCIGRRILDHWTAREAPGCFFKTLSPHCPQPGDGTHSVIHCEVPVMIIYLYLPWNKDQRRAPLVPETGVLPPQAL